MGFFAGEGLAYGGEQMKRRVTENRERKTWMLVTKEIQGLDSGQFVMDSVAQHRAFLRNNKKKNFLE